MENTNDISSRRSAVLPDDGVVTFFLADLFLLLRWRDDVRCWGSVCWPGPCGGTSEWPVLDTETELAHCDGETDEVSSHSAHDPVTVSADESAPWTVSSEGDSSLSTMLANSAAVESTWSTVTAGSNMVAEMVGSSFSLLQESAGSNTVAEMVGLSFSLLQKPFISKCWVVSSSSRLDNSICTRHYQPRETFTQLTYITEPLHCQVTVHLSSSNFF